MTHATLAAEITRSVGPGQGICPVCAAVHRLSKSGALPRHGFSAKNVRHGQNSGYHIGGHGGEQPIGTEAGNHVAYVTAERQVAEAGRLAALPPFTLADASASARGEMFSNERRRYGRQIAGIPTEEEVRSDRMWIGYRSWLNADSLEARRQRMDQERAAEIASRRAHAALLTALIAANPSQRAA